MTLARPFSLILMFVLFGCETSPEKPNIIEFLPFDQAAATLSGALSDQLASNQSLLEKIGESTVVVDELIDADTGEATEATKRVQDYLLAAGKQRKFNISRVTSDGLAKAQYVVTGIIKYETVPGAYGKGKAYRISVSVVNVKTALVVANRDAWVANKKIANQPIGIYQDAPMYLKDAYTEAKIQTAQTPTGQPAAREYKEALPTEALIAQADSLFEQGEYARAVQLYRVVAARPDGRRMKLYAGLYQAYRKLNQLQEAENAFSELISQAVLENRVNIKFLFDVGAVNFYRGIDMAQDYPMWLRQLAKAVGSSGKCLKIIGHSSRSGTEQFNQQLSTQRALHLQAILMAQIPDLERRSIAIGRGFKDNIIGTGTDDQQDALDRRVEFQLQECPLKQVQSGGDFHTTS